MVLKHITLLLWPFCDSTIQFIADDTNAITNELIFHCVIFQCVLLIFKARKQSYSNSTASKRYLFDHQREMFMASGRLIYRQKLSGPNLLLVSDLTFSDVNWEDADFHKDITQRLQMPIKIPAAILFTSNESVQAPQYKSSNLVKAVFNTAMLIQINLVGGFFEIGSFSCRASTRLEVKQKCESGRMNLTFLQVPRPSMKSFDAIFSFWKTYRIKITFEPINRSMCTSQPEMNEFLNVVAPEPELCQTFHDYFSYKNCSNSELCFYYYNFIVAQRQAKSNQFITHSLQVIIPYAQMQTEYSIQIFFPKVHFLDVNLGAFLLPFSTSVWIGVLIAIISKVLFLVYFANHDFQEVCLWLYSVVFEQTGNNHMLKSLTEKTILIFSLFSMIFLRDLYNSALYSFITAEPEPFNYPKNVAKLLSRTDFDIMSTSGPYHEMAYFVEKWHAGDLPQELKNLTVLYIGIILKMHRMEDDIEVQTVENATKGLTTHINYYSPKFPTNKSNLLETKIYRDSWNRRNATFASFAVICENDCQILLNPAISSNQTLHQLSFKEALLVANKFWIQYYISFEAFSLKRFLQSFAESGLYERSVVYHYMLNQLQQLVELNTQQKHGIPNGTLYSFVFLANGKTAMVQQRCKPTTLSALTGTICIAGCGILFAMIMFLFEASACLKINS